MRKLALVVGLTCAWLAGCQEGSAPVPAVTASSSPSPVSKAVESRTVISPDSPALVPGSASAVLEQIDAQLKTEPENGLLWARRFQAHYALGDQKAALADLDSLEKIDGKIKWVQNNRAFLLAEMGEFEKALPDALAAAEKPPDDPGSWDTVGYVYVGLGKDKEAVEAYDRAIAHKAKPNYLWGRAVALRRLGQSEAAEADFRRARRIQPGFSLKWNLDPDPGVYSRDDRL